jgi:hypothetical protein
MTTKQQGFSKSVRVFNSLTAPEEGTLAGYAALIDGLQLAMPMPLVLSLVSPKRRNYSTLHWKVYSSRAAFEDTLYKHLVFALKYEGINLLFFSKLFQHMQSAEVVSLLKIEPTGQYSRKLWFLYEWLTNKQLPIPDLTIKNFVPLLDEEIQYGIAGQRSPRHRIINNLPGTVNFCPLIYRTQKLEAHRSINWKEKNKHYLQNLHKEVIQRAAAFLLLKDSKASFTIEGESPKSRRAARWGQAIGQAGVQQLNEAELLRLQQLVIENTRFVAMGFRKQGGFVGEHDRATGEPLPDHISARWQDIETLVAGVLATHELLTEKDFDAVLAAAVIAFGFVFIHPFEDGNGRIHRYLIHHVLAKKQFAQQGIIFPVSASILERLHDYRKVLESYSHPLLDLIDWKETKDHNVEVTNETLDYYRYFDATAQAEFLYDCVQDTIEKIIPQEINYLTRYDAFKKYLEEEYEMPDKMVAQVVRFLEQNNGQLSKRAREKEFVQLSAEEVATIEMKYKEVFFEM